MKRSSASSRDLAALGVIAVAAIVGFVGLVSARVNDSLATERATLSRLLDGPRSSPMEHEADVVAQRAARLSAWIDAEQVTVDQSVLYERLLRLAEAGGVRVDRIDPSAVRPAADGRSASYGFTFAAVGTYESVARLLGGIETELGVSAVTRFSLAPASDANAEQVRASIEMTHLQIKQSTALADVEETAP